MRQRDYIFAETDDTCAVCGIRGNEILTEHHIDGDRTNNTYINLIVLCHNCHKKHHDNKGLTTEQIEDRKRHLIQKTLTQYGLNALKIASRNNFGVVAMPFLLYHLVDLQFMTKEEAQMSYGEQEDVTARFSISESGKNVLLKYFP